ncbi:sensor histidine kinase [Hymenobacter terricola]|uniref:sensor histidine kinase n=1 Tax=Hymenobacter terricola TaxID=2819236 RepID=UPI001B304AEE|nr:HAMP domain-containing sensor histidine kinase [Hymenobacter terricola]
MAKKGYINPKFLTPAQLNLKIQRLNETIEKNRLANTVKYNALENFTTLLTAFAGHDIKNALLNMEGVVQLLNINNVTEEDILNIKECTSRIRETLEEFTNLGLPQDTNVIEPFEIVKLMSSLNILHRHNLLYDIIDYTVIYKVPKSTLVQQNFHWLIQSFNNIYINARNALKGVAGKKLQVTISRDETNLTVLVSDNGVGILPENRKRIFEPFFTTTKGSGIGLAHVVRVMENVHGHVSLSEEPGFTTTFKVTFPLLCDTQS